jgi:hypothetical protein
VVRDLLTRRFAVDGYDLKHACVTRATGIIKQHTRIHTQRYTHAMDGGQCQKDKPPPANVFHVLLQQRDVPNGHVGAPLRHTPAAAAGTGAGAAASTSSPSRTTSTTSSSASSSTSNTSSTSVQPAEGKTRSSAQKAFQYVPPRIDADRYQAEVPAVVVEEDANAEEAQTQSSATCLTLGHENPDPTAALGKQGHMSQMSGARWDSS